MLEMFLAEEHKPPPKASVAVLGITGLLTEGERKKVSQI